MSEYYVQLLLGRVVATRYSSGNSAHPHLLLSQQVSSAWSWTTVIHMFKKFTAFSETERTLPHSQKPVPGSRSDLDKSNLHLNNKRPLTHATRTAYGVQTHVFKYAEL